MSKNYYEILGIEKNASKEEIKRAFYRKAKIYHPDVNTSSNAADVFLLIEEAYQTLYDEDKRREYDRQSQRQAQNTDSRVPDGPSGEQRYGNSAGAAAPNDSTPGRSQSERPYGYGGRYSAPTPPYRSAPNYGSAPRGAPAAPPRRHRKGTKILRNLLLSPIYFIVVVMEKIVVFLGGILMIAGVGLFGLGIVMGVVRFCQNAPLNPDIYSWFLIALGGILIFLLPTIVIRGISAARSYLHDVFYDE